jgi:CHAT domain-containing protein
MPDDSALGKWLQQFLDWIQQFINHQLGEDELIQLCPPDKLDEFVPILKQEVNRHWSIDPKISMRLAEVIIKIGYRTENQAHIALGTMARGDSRKFADEFEEAWNDLEEAARLYTEIGDAIGWARTRIGLVWVSMELKRVDMALPQAEKAHEILSASNLTELLINLELNLGSVHQWMHPGEESLKHFYAALERAQALGEHGQSYLGRLYLNLGNTYRLIGDFRKAESFFERALEFFTQTTQSFWLASAKASLAAIFERTGKLRSSLVLLNSARQDAKRTSTFLQVQMLHRLMQNYSSLNRYIEGYKLGHSIILGYETLNAQYSKAQGLLDFARLIVEANLAPFYQEAVQSLNLAEPLFRENLANFWLTEIKLWRALIALKQDKLQETIEVLKQLLPELEFQEHYFEVGLARLIWANSLLHQGYLDEAVLIAQQALELAKLHLHIEHNYSAHVLLGQIYRQMQMLSQAQTHFEAAVAIVDYLQKDLTITLRSDFLKNKGQAIHELIGLHLDASQVETAFTWLEHTKSQVLLNYLSGQENPRWLTDHPESRPLLDRLQNLREDYHWYTHLLRDKQEQSQSLSLDEIRQKLQDIEQEIHTLREQLYLYTEQSNRQIEVSPPNFDQIRAKLGPSACLLEYYNDGKHLWCFVINAQAIQVYPLAISIEALDKLIDQFQANIRYALAAGPQDKRSQVLAIQNKQIGQRLYTALLQDILEKIQPCQHLIIVPYGNLHALPFHTLFTGTNYLIQHYEVVILPTAGLLAKSSPVQIGKALIIAHSDDGDLPAALNEAELVYSLFGGELKQEKEANRTVLNRPPSQILHISAHGAFHMDYPELSCIYLEDGPLYTDDLLQLDMSYELITLSACETGLAKLAPGDELIGLGRSCLYAGAGALLLSLWKVEDQITYRLMQNFYEALLHGASKSAALRQAQCNLLTEQPTLHSAFWGAFQLIGDSAPLSKNHTH